MNRSPTKMVVPSGRTIRRNDRQRKPAGSPRPGGSPQGSKKNRASNKAILHSKLCVLSGSNDLKTTLRSIGDVSVIEAEDGAIGVRPTVPLTCKCESIRRYASTIHNPSSDEISIIHLALLTGWDNAEVLAADFGFKSDRPLRDLLSIRPKIT